jgi:hypothetical protein
MTPTARTMQRLRQLGYLAARVEVYLPAVRRHRDLFGVADVLAVHPRERLPVLLVQATTAGHVPDRLRRLQARPETPLLLRAGLAVEVWGWRKIRDRWRVRIVAVRAEDLAAVALQALPRWRRARKGERQRDLF